MCLELSHAASAFIFMTCEVAPNIINSISQQKKHTEKLSDSCRFTQSGRSRVQTHAQRYNYELKTNLAHLFIHQTLKGHLPGVRAGLWSTL